MGASSGGDNGDNPIADINITPLVDIVLVLLIIFMITAPQLYQNSIEVNLPKAQSGEKSEKTPLTFVVKKDGDLFWDKEKVKWDELSDKLKALGGAKNRIAVITADKETPHGIVMRLMDTLRLAGLTRIQITVEGAGL